MKLSKPGERKMENKTYNGWTNYETWVVNLLLSNDENSYRYYQERAEAAYEEAEASEDFTRAENATFALQKVLDEELSEGFAKIEMPGLYADLLGAALKEVNTYEIAKSMIEDLDHDCHASEEDGCACQEGEA